MLSHVVELGLADSSEASFVDLHAWGQVLYTKAPFCWKGQFLQDICGLCI